MPQLQPPPFDVEFRDPKTNDIAEVWRRFLLNQQQAIADDTAPSDAQYLVATANTSLTNERNLGALTTGHLSITVAAGIATPTSSATIPAADLSGTIADARFPSTLPAVSGVNLTSLTGGNETYAQAQKATVDSPYLFSATDVFVNMNATAGIATVKLPAAPVTGRLYSCLKSDASGNVVTLDGNGHTINGAATVALAAQYNSRLVRYTGTEFLVVAST